VGLSNGANIAATILQLVPETLRGAILFRAMVVLDEKPPPGRLVGKTIFMSSGELDPIVPREHPEQLKAMFAHAGAEVELQWQKASHGLVSADIVSARAWATKHLY